MTTIAEPILKLFRKLTTPEIEVGDVVRVHQKIREGAKERIQVFEGIVIATNHGKSVNASFTVRKIASGVGVEKVFLLHSPNIVKVEFKRGSAVKRAKLYYLRSLTGKALKMKDRAVKKDAWAEVLGQATDVPTEASEADIAEAVKADEEKQASEAAVGNEEAASGENVEQAEDVSNSNETTNEATEETSGEEQSDAGAGTDTEGDRN
jgi:large subunit ribosomal protein L19